MAENSRREFLKRSLAIVAAAPVVAALSSGTAHAQELPKNALSESDPMATALGYAEDATKVDTVKYPKKSGAEGAKQSCTNCQFYQQGGLKVDGKEGEFGKCLMFATGLVAAKGWCNSWAPKMA
jgi:hypothetical protein